MKKSLRIDAGLIVVALFVALLVAGALLGGFGRTRVNGSTV